MRLTMGMLAVASVALMACGDDGAHPEVDAGGDSGSTVADGGGGDGSLTVHVYRVDDGEATDGDGIAVALDTPAGRVEGTTAADGTFTFEGIDGSAGATVIAWEAGRVMMAVELSEAPDAEQPLYLFEAGTPREDLVTLSGVVAGMEDTTHTLFVSSTTGGFASGVGVGWAMEVPPDEAGALVAVEATTVAGPDRVSAFEVLQMATADFAAPGSASTVDVDFAADGAATETVTGSFPNPSSPRPSSVVNTGEVFLRVSSRDAGAFLGVASRMEISADEDTLDYDVTYLELAGVEEPTTTFIVSDAPLQSFVTVEGWPSAGVQDVAFLDPPDVTSPPFGEDLAWGSTARWDTADTEIRTSIQVFDRDTKFLRAVLVVAPDRSSGALPPPPGDATVLDVLDGSEVDARITHCDSEGAPRPWMCGRSARSRAFGVAP